MNSKITGVILAAGEGSRIFPLNKETSKTIMPILNKPLIEHHIDAFKNAGITEIIIVIGSNSHKVVNTIGNGDKFGVKIRYVEQKERLGIAHAVGTLEEFIHNPFILTLGDIYFVADNLRSMVDKFHSENLQGVLSTKIDSPENIKRNFAVIQDGNGFVKRVIEKPRYIENNLKGCGLYMFSLNIFDAIRRTPRTAQRNEYEITNAIQILIDDGHSVKTINNIAEDLNLTYPHDLLQINLKEVLRLNNGNSVIGKNTLIKNPQNLRASVIGEGVVIKEDISIKNCLIFPNTIVYTNEDIENMILTPFNQIDCKVQMKSNITESQLRKEM